MNYLAGPRACAPFICSALALALALALARADAATPGEPASAGSPTVATAPPFDLADTARIEIGKKRFNSTCAAYCHGAEGVGGKTPSFKGRTDFSPHDAFKVITEGRRGADVMPPWGNAYTPEQIWELVAYLQFLSKLPQ
jgi:mono/diheme cytochrome c family protein